VFKIGLLSICILSGPVLAATAKPATTEDLRETVRTQEKRIVELQRRISALEARMNMSSRGNSTDQPGPSAETTAAPNQQQPPPNASRESEATSIEWKGAPELTSANTNYSAKLRGRIQSDAWAVSGDPEIRDYPSGTELRAVRLGIQGALGPVLSYEAEADFAGNSVTVKAAYLQYKGSSPWTLRAGNLKPHISLENKTGLPRLTFMERSLPNVFAISDEVPGISAATNGQRWSLGISAFGEAPDSQFEGNEAVGASARITYAPLLSDNRLVHIGASGMRQHFGADAGQDFRLRQRPEVHLFSTRLLDTGGIDADDSSTLGIEFAAVAGPLSAQAEYLRKRVDYSEQPSATFDGFYTYLSWLVTGESRPYSASSGKFGRIRPHKELASGGPGALELALRYSTLDLSDGPALGGEAANITLGLNWYMTDYAKLAFNWVHFDVDDSISTVPFSSGSHEGNAFGVRAQVDW